MYSGQMVQDVPIEASPAQFMTVIYSMEYDGEGNETGNETGNVRRIVLSIGKETLTRDEIMQRMGLKGSGNFRASYLYPAIEQGYVLKLYPKSDKRRDQAYYLSEKGLRLIDGN